MRVRLQMVVAISVAFGAIHSVLAAHTTSSLSYRYAYSDDGYNQDRDDVAGSAMVVAIFDRLGWGDRLVHFHFNTNFGGQSTHAEEHRKSVLWTAKLFGMIDEVDADDGYFDVSRSPEEKAAAIEHLAEEIRRSERRDPLMIFCGGGVQVPYAALKRAIQKGILVEDLQAVTFVSHSVANERTRQKGHPEYGVNWSDLVKLSPYPTFVDHTSPRVNARKDSDVIQGDQNRTGLQVSGDSDSAQVAFAVADLWPGSDITTPTRSTGPRPWLNIAKASSLMISRPLSRPWKRPWRVGAATPTWRAASIGPRSWHGARISTGRP